MPAFVPGTPVETTEPTVEVTVDPQRPLPIGRHRFQLVVVDDSGNRSAPDTVDVVVRDSQNPTAVLRVASQVEFGKSITLDGRASSDVPPGKIARYIWTMLD
ncbi:MAG: hypothetical protein HY822_05770 [Acidobacteria bacterium]|nr:hypothetical protein [Acidobacteriota bacterium]